MISLHYNSKNLLGNYRWGVHGTFLQEAPYRAPSKVTQFLAVLMENEF